MRLGITKHFPRWTAIGFATVLSAGLTACADDDVDDDSTGDDPDMTTALGTAGTMGTGGVATMTGIATAGGTGSEDATAIPQDLDDGPTIVGLDVTGPTGMSLRTIALHHPLTVHMWVQPEAGGPDIHDHVYHVGLVQKHDPGADHALMQTCQLGTLRLAHGTEQVDENGNVQLYGEFDVPSDCMPAGATQAVFNLWVATNPALEVAHDGAGGVHDDDYNTQFFTSEFLDTDGKNRNVSCHAPDTGAGCIIDLTLLASPGLDIEFRDMMVDNTVFQVNSDCALQTGHPDLETTLDLRIHGRASFANAAGGETPANVLDEELDISYSICPRDATTGECVAGADYEVIGSLGHEDGAMMSNGAVHSASPLRYMYSGTSNVEHHDLHLEHNAQLCTNLMNNEGATADWSSYNNFNLKACVSTPAITPESGLCDVNGHCDGSHHDLLNNCRTVPVRIVRVIEPEAPTSTKTYEYGWNKSGGGSVVGASAKFWSKTQFSLDGATTSNGGQFSLTGWVSAEIFKAWFDAQAYVSLVGSGYDTGIRIFSKSVYSKSQTVPEVTYSNTKDISKQLCYSYNYGIAGIGLNASLCATGSVSLGVDASIKAVEGAGVAPFDEATRIGEAQATVTPGADFGLSATASVNVVVARGGITGTLDLIVVSLPITGTLNWGLISGPRLVLTNNLKVDLNTTFLRGRLNVWVDLLKPKWCSCGSWCPGYPCSSWSSVVNKTLVSFSAYSLNRTVYDNSVINPIYLP